MYVLGQRSAAAERIAELRSRELEETNDELSVVNRELALRNAELRQHATVDGFVQRATSEVSHARTVQDALERLRTVLLDVADFDRVGYSERVDERRMLVRDVAGPGAATAPAGVEYVASRRLWESLATRDLVVIQDTSDAAEGTVEAVLWDRGIHGIITLPLVARGEVAGVLTLGATSPLDLSAGDVRLLSRVADGIAGPLGALLGLEAEQQAAAQLRQLDELKDEFLGIVAHDLRGPLTVVTGYTELLLAEHAAGTFDRRVVAEGLTAMQRAASHQERLIAALLESQRLALGVAVPTRTPIVLAELVRETVRDLASGTTARVAFDDLSDGRQVSADGEWIRRVVVNLVTNAWKYGSPVIDVELHRGDGTVRVEVRDHGPGISPTDLPRLFQRFTRLERVGPDQPAGTGLGLYICRQLVEAHGGAVGADSLSGVGSTFWFDLPTLDAGSALPV